MSEKNGNNGNGRAWVVRKSPIAGRGVFALRDIPKGTRIIEYRGERISPDEGDERYDDDSMEHVHTLLFNVDEETVIDGGVRGNAARFINHSCDPNCQSVVEDGRVFIDALKHIPEGTELTYDYHLVRTGRFRAEWRERYACRCGTRRCRGLLLDSPRPPKRARRAKRVAKRVAKRAARRTTRRAPARASR
jgi:uncharacterized protein